MMYKWSLIYNDVNVVVYATSVNDMKAELGKFFDFKDDNAVIIKSIEAQPGYWKEHLNGN